MRLCILLLLLSVGLCRAASANTVALDTLRLPFFDDFAAAPNGQPSTRYWQHSQVQVNNQYALRQKTVGVATFDILDNDGRVYSHADPYGFYADTLASHAFEFAGGEQNVYLSFYIQPGGVADMPEEPDSLLLFFWRDNHWYPVWRACTNGTLSDPADTLLQFYADASGQFSPAGEKGATPLDSNFVQVMVPVPNDFLQTGFRFQFVNRATRTAGEVAGMAGNCDLWHLDMVYLNKDRSATDTTLVDMAIQRPLGSFLKTYESIPWRHLIQSSAAQQEQLRTNGQVVVPYNMVNLSQGSSPVNVQMNLSLTKGGSFSKTYDFGSRNIYPDTLLSFSENIPVSDILESPDPGADSVAFAVQFTLSRYYIAPEPLRSHLTANDTSRYLQQFYDYYAYDDGTAENGFGIFGANAAGAEVAVRFNTYLRDTLSGVHLYFNNTVDSGNLQDFLLTVRASEGGMPGRLLYQDSYTSQFAGLNQFVWYKLNHRVVVEGEYFVGLRQKNTVMLNLGMDMNRHTAGNTYVNLGTAWELSRQDALGSLMIRPSFAPITWEMSTDVRAAGEQSARPVFYPNPVRGALYAQLPDRWQGESLQVSIFNLSGACVAQYPQFSQPLNVAHLPQGVYWVQLQAGGKVLAVQKILVYSAAAQ